MFSPITALMKRNENAASLMGRMAAHAGVDLTAACQMQLGMEVSQLMRTCRGCRNRQICQRFMAGEGPADYHDFCPNAGVFDRLRERLEH